MIVRRSDACGKWHDTLPKACWLRQQIHPHLYLWSKERFMILCICSPLSFPLSPCLFAHYLSELGLSKQICQLTFLTLRHCKNEISPEWHFHQATYCLDLLQLVPFLWYKQGWCAAASKSGGYLKLHEHTICWSHSLSHSLVWTDRQPVGQMDGTGGWDIDGFTRLTILKGRAVTSISS